MYDAIVEKLDSSGAKLASFVNAAWPHYMPDKDEFKKYPDMIKVASKERVQILKDISSLKDEMKKDGQ